MEHAVTLRIMVLLLGALACGYLVYLFLYKQVFPLLALVGSALLTWFLGQFLLTGLRSVFGTVSPSLRDTLMLVSCAGLLMDSPFLLHAMLTYLRGEVEIPAPGWWVSLVYLPVLVPVLAVLSGPGTPVPSRLTDPFTIRMFLAVKSLYIAVICSLSWWLARRTSRRDLQFFSTWFPVSLLAALASGWGVSLYAGLPGSGNLTTLTYGAPLFPVLLFLWTVHRYRLLSVEITERSVFAFSAVLTLFLYFYVIRRAGSRLERAYGINAEALEIVLFLLLVVMLTIAGHWTLKLTDTRVRRSSFRVLDALADRLSESEMDREQGIRLVADKLEEAFDAPVEVIRPDEEPDLFDVLDDPPRQPITVLDRNHPSLVRLLRNRDGSMFVPLSDPDRILALLLVGPRRRFLNYSPGEREAIALVMRQFRESVRNHDLIRKRLELEQKLQQDEKLEALGSVAASCAHEVKNPLSSIHGIVSNMEEELDESERHHRDVRVIQQEIDRLDSVVQQILTFARRGEDDTRSIDVTELLQGVAYVLGKAPEGVRVEVDLPDHALLRARAVESDLKGVLFNLLRNALEASPRGERVEIRLTGEDENVRIAITNHGDPPDDDVLDTIRSQDKTPDPARRNGFGLPIVQNQLHDMNGSLEADVQDDTTTFVVRLPRDQASE